MTDQAYLFVLAAIFIIHNAEEYVFFHRMPKKFIFKNRKSFLFSIAMLSLLVILSAIFGFLFKESRFFQAVNSVVLFSLSINAVQHVVFSIWYRKILPGTFSAALLIFPFSLLCFTKLVKWEGFGFIGCLILTPIAMVLFILVTLRLGNWLYSNSLEKEIEDGRG